MEKLSKEEREKRQKEATLKWRTNNPEKFKESVKKYRDSHKEELKLKRQIYILNNKEKVAKSVRNYSQNNKEKIKIRRDNYLSTMTVKERSRKNHLWRKYKITIEDYDKILLIQNNLCKCCKKLGNNDKRGMLHVDHCHETGKVRGLLCDNCNRALGMVKDNIETLKEMINYLNINYDRKIKT